VIHLEDTEADIANISHCMTAKLLKEFLDWIMYCVKVRLTNRSKISPYFPRISLIRSSHLSPKFAFGALMSKLKERNKSYQLCFLINNFWFQFPSIYRTITWACWVVTWTCWTVSRGTMRGPKQPSLGCS
jgi:hypothetical protein